MKVLFVMLPFLLLQASSAIAQVAPVGRQAPSASGPSTLATTTTTPAAVTTSLSSTSTLLDDSDDADTTTTSATATPTGPRNHNVAVGQNGTQFTPSALKNITVGDTLTFYFYPSNYSIVQSSFAAACAPITHDGGVDQKAIFSGFHPAAAGSIAKEKFITTIQSTETTWFYALDGTILASSSESANACEKGMVMVINPLPKDQAAGETLKAYKKNAAGLARHNITCPSEVWGGELKPLSDKQVARWLSKHPLGGNPKNNTTTNNTGSESGSGSGDDVMQYQNGAAVYSHENSLMAVIVLVGASVFGLGM